MPDTVNPLELVEWRDANFSFSDPDWDNLNDEYLVATAGWTTDTDKWVVVVSEITPEGERSVTRIPKENVVSRKRLSIGEDVRRIEKWDDPTEFPT